MIRKCTPCKPHEFQDATYGKGFRVFNANAKQDKERCTVCGKQTGNNVTSKKPVVEADKP